MGIISLNLQQTSHIDIHILGSHRLVYPENLKTCENPEKKYPHISSLDELEEILPIVYMNKYNLKIPRFVDLFTQKISKRVNIQGKKTLCT